MQRYFYVSNNIDELEQMETELEERGIPDLQMHVIGHDDSQANTSSRLNHVHSLARKDIVRSTMIGLAIGVVVVALLLVIVSTTGAAQAVGWMPFIFLAVVLFGFCTWEGGLWGIQEPHRQFRQYDAALKEGKHLFFVDVADGEKVALDQVASQHPQVQAVGAGESEPGWWLGFKLRWKAFVNSAP